MKKNFSTLQTKFYNKVKTYLPAFYKKADTIQLTKVSDGSLAVYFEYLEVTGAVMRESISLDASDDVNEVFTEFRERLKETYPGFVKFQMYVDMAENRIKTLTDAMAS